MGLQRDGRETLIVIVKATWTLPAFGHAPTIAAEQIPLIEADCFTGEPGFSAPLYETDYAHFKPACDVLLIGSAYAPAGRPATRVNVGISVGTVFKQFAVVGPRRWRKCLTGVRPDDPAPFVRLRLGYDVAFGGTDRTEEPDGRTATYLTNPVGLGYWRHTAQIDGQPLPNTEQIGVPVTDPGGRYAPMALSPIGRNWMPRSQFAGTYDQTWLENTAPLWPDDFDTRYFQAAPADQILPYPKGGEDITLLNLTPNGRHRFRLPEKRMPVTFIPYRGRDVTREAFLDTIVLEPDDERFTLTWRATLALGRSIFDVKEVVAGEMSAAWHRSRRFPYKTYYRSLVEAVNAHRARRGPQ
ncbi:DUF2169 domain-containing protein [Caballeronia novacaledonica]|uniref:DUF2169 domain-containing protein n=1 Tax=Caballeronia novacaledonica TaxID=1544861 RepID=A0ACB5R483_9BURK|nr:DUF2169 domain-containing protein [Caballeronia novacaledonica]